jgi:hypothetical protein
MGWGIAITFTDKIFRVALILFSLADTRSFSCMDASGIGMENGVP